MKNIKLTTQEDYKQRVDMVVEYVRENLDKEISMRALAELAAFSPFHFHRVMRAHLGETIGSFIIRARIETAAKLLRFTDNSVTDIAYKVGYDTPSSLTKAFCKMFGISPIKYRLTKNYKIMSTQIQKPTIKISRGKIVEQEPKSVIYVSSKGKYSNLDFTSTYLRLWGIVKEQELYSAGIEHLAICHDDPEITAEENLKCDICLRICKPAKPTGDIGVKTFGGGKFAMFTYIGEYDKLGFAYDKIYGELLAKLGLKTRGNYCYEKYVSDPRRVAPEKLKTEIYIPVE